MDCKSLTIQAFFYTPAVERCLPVDVFVITWRAVGLPLMLAVLRPDATAKCYSRELKRKYSETSPVTPIVFSVAVFKNQSSQEMGICILFNRLDAWQQLACFQD